MPKAEMSDIALTLLGILFGFLTLMSGSAVGFLVSQCWYIVYFAAGYVSRKSGWLFRSYKVLRDEREVKGEMKFLEPIFNHIVHSTEKGIRAYFNRRWDLAMLFGSTITAIGLGLFTGYFVRCFIVNSNNIPLSQQTYVNWVIYDQLILGASSVLVILLFAGLYVVWEQHNRMSTLLIRQKSTQDLRNKFPNEYFQPKK